MSVISANSCSAGVNSSSKSRSRSASLSSMLKVSGDLPPRLIIDCFLFSSRVNWLCPYLLSTFSIGGYYVRSEVARDAIGFSYTGGSFF